MKVKFLQAAQYLKKFFFREDREPKNSGGSSKDNTLKHLLKRFLDEGWSFWLDPFDSYRKNFITRAGPILS